MTAPTTIIGGGIGGFTVAKELRALDPEVAITIIDKEGLPYDRPPLSKDVLSGEKSKDDLLFVPATWYEENNVQVLTGDVTRVDGEAREIHLADGTVLSYENLVLATGGFARRGTTPGFDEHVTVLRTTADAEELQAALKENIHLGIIGAGLIGAEVASSARKLGAQVTLIDPVPVALVPAVGADIATHLHKLHADNGVTFIQGTTTAVIPTDTGVSISIDGQDSVSVDKVLLCIGLIPDESLAKSLGLDCDGGVLVDHEQRTDAPGVWAVGDCARLRNADGTLERRHEHWDSAVQEGRAAAYSIAGQPIPKGSASWFWSDRYGAHVEGTGDMHTAGETVIRRNDDGTPAVAFNVGADGRLLGAASVNESMAVRAARRIIDRGIVVDKEKLADSSIPLKKLAR